MDEKPGQDEQLFLRLKTGDALAYEEIYSKYSKFLLQAAYNKLRDKIAAEDLVQNIFISIWEKRASMDIKDTKNYLLGSLKYAVINYIRTKMMEHKYLAFIQKYNLEHTADFESENVLHALELKDLSHLIEEGISSLPDKTREVFKLSRIEHHSAKKISLELKISEKTVEYHITRSLKLIKAYLKNYLLLALFFFIL